MLLHQNFGYRLGWGLLASLTLLLGSEGVVAQDDVPRWRLETPQTDNNRQFQRRQSLPGITLSTAELEQTLRALELIQRLGIPSFNGDQIGLLQVQLRQLPREQASPYQLSSEQTQQLKRIFSGLEETQLKAINKILLTQETGTSLKLTPEERTSLLNVLSTIPEQNLSELQRRQLEVVLEFLRQIPQQEVVTLSPEQTQALETAIAYVFFTPATQSPQTAERPTTRPSEQVTLTPAELQQTIRGLQAIQQGGLRPAQAQEITTLVEQLQQLQAETDTAVTLSPQQTQELRTLFDSLNADEVAALEILLLSDRAPETLTLTQDEIEELIVFFQDLPEEELTATQRQQQQVLVEFLRQLQAREEAEIQLSSAQTQSFLQGIQILVFDQGAIAQAGIPLNQLQEIITYLETAQAELSLSSSETETLNNLTQDLTRLKANENQRFVIPPEQNQQLLSFIDSLNRRQRRNLQREFIVQDGGSVSSPAISVLNPIGYGNSFGNLGVGLSFQERTRFGDNEDGALSFSMGFGDPEESVGIGSTVSILSLTDDNQSAAFSTGSLSLEVSRNLPGNSAVSLGVENLIRWPEGSGDSGTSTYLVGSTLFQLREDTLSPFALAYLTAGIGNGRFRPPENLDLKDDEFFVFNPFASVALQVIPRVNAIAEWTGQDLSAGLSIVPFRRLPLVITLAGIDLTGRAEDFRFGEGEGEPRFTGSVSYGFFF
jgi:hypothetical protein